jgi:hypothetical protein
MEPIEPKQSVDYPEPPDHDDCDCSLAGCMTLMAIAFLGGLIVGMLI